MSRIYYIFSAILMGAICGTPLLQAMENEGYTPERSSGRVVRDMPLAVGKSAFDMLDNLKVRLDKEFDGYAKDTRGQDAYYSLPSCISSFTWLLMRGIYNDPYDRLPANDKKKTLGSGITSKKYGIRRQKANEQEKTKILGYIAYLAQKAHQYPKLERYIKNDQNGFGYMTKNTFVTGKGADYITVHGYLVCMAYDFMKAALQKQFNLPDSAVSSLKFKTTISDAISQDLLRGYVTHFNIPYHSVTDFGADYAISHKRDEYYQLRDRIGAYFSTFEDNWGPFSLDQFLAPYKSVMPALVQAREGGQGRSSASYFDSSRSFSPFPYISPTNTGENSSYSLGGYGRDLFGGEATENRLFNQAEEPQDDDD